MPGIIRYLRRWGLLPQGYEQPPLSEHPKPDRSTFQQMLDEIKLRNPELALSWTALYAKAPSVAGDWLDEHYPIPGGWGPTLIGAAPELLRRHYPHAND